MMKLNYKELSKEYRNILINSDNEEDVRIATATVLQKIISNMDFPSQSEIEPFGKHEYTLFSGGRIDSLYSNVIIEYKRKGYLNKKIELEQAINGRNSSKKNAGLKYYILNYSDEKSIDMRQFAKLSTEIIGIAIDGFNFVFYRLIEADDSNYDTKYNFKGKTFYFNEYKYNEKNIEEAFKKITLYFRSTSRPYLSRETMLSNFGAKDESTQEIIQYLYQTSLESENKRVNILYDEWLRIFGVLYGESDTYNNDFSGEFINMYNFPPNVDVKRALYSFQTYYNIVLKLLVFYMLKSIEDPSFKYDVENLMHHRMSQIFNGTDVDHQLIENFFEVHFFEWFTFEKNFDYKIITGILIKINNIEITTSVLKPEIIHDVLRDFYEDLIPIKLRRRMGEYYTPEWLVDFTLEKCGYDGDLSKKVLDPTCGSGSFLTHAIKIASNKNNKDPLLVEKICESIYGFDINPIAIISAKTNYILALGDFSKLNKKISIPIFLCDSTLAPTVYSKNKRNGKPVEIETIVGTFSVPYFNDMKVAEIFFRLILEKIEAPLYTFEKFFKNFCDISFVTLTDNLYDECEVFYEQIHKHHNAGENGFWTTILKNSFAPLYTLENFDYVVGNPPWITWRNMSKEFRKQTLDVWLSYGIFEKSGYDKKTTHDDFAMAVTYVSIDHYCKPNGITGFILPQQFLKSSKGGEGFRKFSLTNVENKSIRNFSVNEVYDFIKIDPFREFATNRASLVVFEKDKEMIYPMNSYNVGKLLNSRKKVNYQDTIASAKLKIDFDRYTAFPVNATDKQSPWLTVAPDYVDTISKMSGKSVYRGRKGIEPCGAKGLYLLDAFPVDLKYIRIENRIQHSRLEKVKQYGVVPGIVEKDFIYPLVGGKNISKWGIHSNCYIIMPHVNDDKKSQYGLPTDELYERAPKTFNWLNQFKDVLLETRIRNGKFFNKDKHPFYRLDNVGPYTFSNFYVVWREQSKEMISCVLTKLSDDSITSNRILVDSKVLYCPLDCEDEAYYLSGVLNSEIVNTFVKSYTIDIQKGIDILRNISIPSYESMDQLHNEICQLSKKCHRCFLSSSESELQNLELILNKKVKKLWRLH